jgi:homocysteine S-methyltransferase
MAFPPSPLAPHLGRQRFLVLDGGLATELERRGANLRDPLWSARVLLDQPEAIRAVHLDYLRAGADVIVGASYQASLEGLLRHGLSVRGAETVLRRSVALAVDARDEFLATTSLKGRVRPLVAASIGPYGAFLHDGSEYRGDYGLTDRELRAFHQPRLEVLATAGADLMACETIPSRREADVLVDLMERRGEVVGWVSFTGGEPGRISDGTSFEVCVAGLTGARSVVAIGINCTPADQIADLLEAAEPATVPFVVYPNGGGWYDGRTGEWQGEARADDIPPLVDRWYDLGARLIGGCCRTTPNTISAIRDLLERTPDERP